MPPRGKVESSEHYAEIHELLLKGKSPRWISNYLKNEYDEIIGYSAIYNYQKKNINIEEQTIEEVNRRATEKAVKEKADTQEQIFETTNYVISQGAENLEGILDVAKNFPRDYKEVRTAISDPDSKVSEKDVAELSYKANKLYLDFIKKQDTNVEVNVNNVDLSEFFDDEEDSEILSDLDAFERRYFEEKETPE